MENSIVSPTTTNKTSKTSKMSFADRLAMGEDIDTIIDDETPTADNVSQPIESTIENHFQSLENENEDNGEINAKMLYFKNKERWAKEGTQKALLYSCFDSYSAAGIPQENWYEKAKKDNTEILEGRVYKCFRYYTVGEYKRPSDGTIVNRTSLTVEQATEKADEILKDATEKAEKLIQDAKERGISLIERAKESEAKKAEQDAKIAAQSVKKAGEVLKSLESIDTSKVELTPEMREMMMKMLGLSTIV